MGCGRIGFEGTDRLDADSGVEADVAHLRCMVPLLPDTGAPDRVVGTGTLASCTEDALRAALPGGGVVAFDCGGPATIVVSSELVVTESTIIDGTGITLDGGGATRIMRSMASELTLVGIRFQGGATTGSGAGLLVQGGSLRIFDSVFADNIGPVLHPSAGGGGVTADPGVPVTIVRSRFENNEAANGGGLYVFSDLTAIDSAFVGNVATGTGGDMDQGGLGGGIRAVGAANNNFCNVLLDGNEANYVGGGYLRIATMTGSDRWDRALVQRNSAVTGGGGMYVQSVSLELDRVAIVGNSAGIGGGLWQPSGSALIATNLLVTGNEAFSGLGGGLTLSSTTGSIRFSTIAQNNASCPSCWPGAIEGSGLSLTATVLANNQAAAPGSPVTCSMPLGDGGANFQFPGGDLCTSAITVVDPLLGESVLASGPAGEFPVMRPLAGSPVIGRATNCPATDLLGNPRPSPCSAGAIEP